MLIRIAPHGAITFISSLYTSLISDKEITRSGILDFLEAHDRKGLMAFMAYKMMLAQGARHLEKGMIHHQGHLEYSQLDIDSWGWPLLTGTCGIQIASTLAPQ